MKKYIVAGFGTSVVALTILPFVPSVAAAQMSTTTLGTAIASVNGTTYDYFTVLLTNYWPFVVGFLILVAVWHFGKRIIGAFN
jgi:hypothetical protein